MAARVMVRVMKAIRIHKFGGPEVLALERDVPVPQPKDTEVLIHCHAAGVNPVDTYIRNGNYSNLPGLPYTPGKDGCGIVTEVGSKVTRFKADDRVYTIFSSSGTYAEYYLAEEKYVFRLHKSVDFQHAAAIGIPYCTAYRALVTRCKARPGQTVLIHGASGAVGIAGCQIARALGLKVIGTAGTKQGLELIKKNGAELAFNHKEDGYTEKIMEATRGVDIVLEMLANVNLCADCQLCKYHGKIAVIGSRASLDFAPRLLITKEVEIYGVSLGTSSEEDVREMEEYLYRCQELGLVKPVVGKVYSLEDAAQAQRDVIEHSEGSHGKIILAI